MFKLKRFIDSGVKGLEGPRVQPHLDVSAPTERPAEVKADANVTLKLFCVLNFTSEIKQWSLYFGHQV